MDGILLINKPVGITSRDAINMLCKRLGTKKIGHTGTLDPFADGLLVVTIGKGTKCGQFLEAQHKTYIATLKLGEETDTFDSEGKIVETKEVPLLTPDIINNVFKEFTGKISQMVPAYSAIKIDGKKLYEYARKGEKIDLPTREVEIDSLKLIDFHDNIIKFEVQCSKGTYIRTLGHDIAINLGTVGHLIGLTRTNVGNFLLKNATKVELTTFAHVKSIYEALSKSLETIEVEGQMETDLKNGKHLRFDNLGDTVFVANRLHAPICVMEKDHDNVYKVVRGLF